MTITIYKNGKLRLPVELSTANSILIRVKESSKEIMFTLVPVYKTDYLNYGYKAIRTNARDRRKNISFRLAIAELQLSLDAIVGEHEIVNSSKKEYSFTIQRRQNAKNTIKTKTKKGTA
jgi:hypothetical protein